MNQGDTTSDAVSKLRVEGLATMEFAGENDTWINTGEKFVVTDHNGIKTEYTIEEVADLEIERQGFKTIVDEENVTIDVKTPCVIGVFDGEGKLLSAHLTKIQMVIKREESMAYINVFSKNKEYLVNLDKLAE